MEHQPTDQPVKKRSKKEIEAKMKKMEEQMEMMMRMMTEKDAEIAELKKKPVRKAKEPKPPTYWEGQVETDGGWKFETAETAMAYAKSLKGDETLLFVMNWNQSFTERKEKTAGKRKPVGEVKNADDEIRCEATTIRNGEIVRCRCKGEFMRGERKICKRHNGDADNHFAKYENWKIEYGTHMGWWDDLSTHHRDWDKAKHPIRKDWVKPTRVKKD